ncbi:cytochrome P450 4C1-like [Adelges cooleyi]|uniref:cytochrome P450 4C1-like n=1 Tax=Adelges cooleyi TaxID=133065 RepID=UPI00217FA90F|nr:cytochrome P450 4C1-like [Adelges cooleyi]
MEIFQDISATALGSLTGIRMSKDEVICYSIIVFLVALWYRMLWHRRHFDKLTSKLSGPPSYPLIGSGLEFVGSPQQVMEKLIKMYETYGPEPFKIWLGMKFAVTVVKPEDLEIVLNGSKALAKDSLYQLFSQVIGEGLFSAPVEKWKKNHRIIRPVFNITLLSQFFSVFNEKDMILIRNLQRELDKDEPFDLWEYVASTTIATICHTAMGYDGDNQDKSGVDFVAALKTSFELNSMRIYKPWLYPNFIFNIYGKLTGIDKVYETLNKLPNKLIKQKKIEFAEKKKNKSSVVDITDNEKKRLQLFLDKLIELNEEGANLTDEEIRDEVVTMLVGGSETTTITNCFCLLMLAIHQDIQDKVYDEIYEVLGDGDQPIAIEDTSKLVYLEQCINETLRLYPVAPLLFRHLTDDIEITNCTLPKGSTMIISPLATHHLPELYPDSWSFNPDNFDPENVAKRHKFSYLAFGGGPRRCIGTKYALFSMHVFIATFLRNFSVHTTWKMSDIKLRLDLMIRSVNGYPVTIRPRDRRPTYKRN